MDIVNSSHSYATGGTSVGEFWYWLSFLVKFLISTKGAIFFSSACFYFNFDKLVAARVCTNNVAEKKKYKTWKKLTLVYTGCYFKHQAWPLQNNDMQTCSRQLKKMTAGVLWTELFEQEINYTKKNSHYYADVRIIHLNLVFRIFSFRESDIHRWQSNSIRTVELLKLLLTTAKQILNVDEILVIYLFGVAAELSWNKGLNLPPIFRGLWTRCSSEAPVQTKHLLLHSRESCSSSCWWSHWKYSMHFTDQV